MNHNDLFLLHPVAYAHAMEVLAAESDMVRNGHAAEQRAVFLQTERDRINAFASVLIAEAWEDLFADLTKHDLVLSIDATRSRFERFGFTGTLREIKNRYRKNGLVFPGIDPSLFWGALVVLKDDLEIATSVERFFEQMWSTMQQHPDNAVAQREYDRIMSSSELLSVRDRQVVEMAADVVPRMLLSTSFFENMVATNAREFVSVYSKVLDVTLVDILATLVSVGQVAHVKSMLRSSIDASTELYRFVIAKVINDRIKALQTVQPVNSVEAVHDDQPLQSEKPAGSEPSIKESPSSAESLLTIQDAMARMKVSRPTINRLMKEGHLIPIHIGRAVRFHAKDIEKYLGLKGKK